jgi:NAD(P)-dependent dehydrogenase (short-subunit alcohol dehydrogenase family)
MKAAIFAADLFKDKVMLVTGAAGGVGGATAELLAALGARLALTDCNAEAVNAKASALDAISISADIASVSDCESIINTTIKHYGRLDALVNCAGIWVEGDSSQAIEAEWDRCIDINLKGTFFVTIQHEIIFVL